MTWEVAGVLIAAILSAGATVVVAILKLVPKRNGPARTNPDNHTREIQSGEMSVEFWQGEFTRVNDEVKRMHRKFDKLKDMLVTKDVIKHGDLE